MNLHALARDRFLDLLIHRAKGDTRSLDELRRAAARQVVREARIAAKTTAPTIQPNASNALDVLIAKLWRIFSNMNAHAELMARKNAPAPPIRPKPSDNPVIITDEPITPATNVIPFKPEPAAPLVSATFSSATIIPDTEFAARYHDRVTEAWRASIQVNAEINRERQARSAAYQAAAKSNYVG
jgi:hypothetical protein